MNRAAIIAAIVAHENQFDDAMEIVAKKASPSWVDRGMLLASQSASILGELRHRLAIIEESE